MKRRLQHQRRGGFTMIEVALAIGMAAVILVSVFALTPMGNNSLRNARNRESEAAILQVLTGHFQMRPWDEVRRLEQRGDDEIFFFNGDGYQMEADGDNRIYTARVSVLDAPQLPGMAGHAAGGGRDTYSRRLKILIDSRPLPEAELFQDEKFYQDYTILIVNTGDEKGQ